MRKALVVILTVLIMLSCPSVVLAKTGNTSGGNGNPLGNGIKPSETMKTNPGQRDSTGGKKQNDLENSKKAILMKCDDMIYQLRKLKGYIVTSDGKFLVEFKDEASGKAALKSLDDAILAVENTQKDVETAASSQELKNIAKNLEMNWSKNQVIVKRMTGLANAARFKDAYDKTEELVGKLGTGIDSMAGDKKSEDIASEFKAIQAKLEEARKNYQNALSLYASITDEKTADKSFRDAHSKLTNAQKMLNACLVDTQKLLVKLKVEVRARLEKGSPVKSKGE